MANTVKYKDIEFPEGLEIHQPGVGKPISEAKKYSLLDWYKLTEATRHVLNSVITQSGRMQLMEMEKVNPDNQKIRQLRELSKMLMEISRDSRNFENKQRMIAIIEKLENVEIG